jgi:putative copper export protein
MFLAGLRRVAAPRAGLDAGVARMVRAFSPLALTGAALAIGTGGLLGVAYVGSLPGLWGSSYGRVLLLKILLLLVTMAFGAWNWRKLSPGLGTPGATAALTRSAAIELIVALLLLSVTAVLVALPAPNIGE